MKSPVVFALALLVAGTAGCSHLESGPRTQRSARAVALAVTVNGRGQPSAAQLAAVRRALAPVLAAENWTLTDKVARNVDLLRVDISPNADDPDGVGIVTIIGFGLKPLGALASRDRVYYPGSDSRYDRPYDPYYDRSRTYDRYIYDQPSYSSGGGGGGSNVTSPPPSQPPPSSPPPSYSNNSNEGRSWGSGATYSAPPPPPSPPPAPSPSFDSGGGRSWGAGAARNDPPPPPPPPPAPPAETPVTPAT